MLLLEELQLFEENGALLAQDCRKEQQLFLPFGIKIWALNFRLEAHILDIPWCLGFLKIKAVLLWLESFVVNFLYSSPFPLL